MLGNGKVLPCCSPKLFSYSLFQQGCYQSPNAYECLKPPLKQAWSAWAVHGLLDPAGSGAGLGRVPSFGAGGDNTRVRRSKAAGETRLAGRSCGHGVTPSFCLVSLLILDGNGSRALPG